MCSPQSNLVAQSFRSSPQFGNIACPFGYSVTEPKKGYHQTRREYELLHLFDAQILILRQYRYKPPPEFLLASPSTRIDHHLSGPIMNALTRIHPKIDRSAVPPCKDSCLIAFVSCIFGLAPLHLHTC